MANILIVELSKSRWPNSVWHCLNLLDCGTSWVELSTSRHTPTADGQARQFWLRRCQEELIAPKWLTEIPGVYCIRREDITSCHCLIVPNTNSRKTFNLGPRTPALICSDKVRVVTNPCVQDKGHTRKYWPHEILCWLRSNSKSRCRRTYRGAHGNVVVKHWRKSWNGQHHDSA